MLLILGEILTVMTLGLRIGLLEPSYLEGNPVIIRCIITSRKLTDFAWFHNNFTVANTSTEIDQIEKGRQYGSIKATKFVNRGGNLVFKLEMTEISRNYSGPWTCKAWSRSNPRVKLQQLTKHLNVLYRPDPEFPTCRIESSGSQAGSRCLLICKSQIGNPPVSLGWYDYLTKVNETKLAYSLEFAQIGLNCDALQAPVKDSEIAVCGLTQSNQIEGFCNVTKQAVYDESKLTLSYNVENKSLNCLLNTIDLKNATLRFNWDNAELIPTIRYTHEVLGISAIFEPNDYIFNGESIKCVLHWGVFSHIERAITLSLPIPTSKETVTTAFNSQATTFISTSSFTEAKPLLTTLVSPTGTTSTTPRIQAPYSPTSLVTERATVLQSTPIRSHQTSKRPSDQQQTTWLRDSTTFAVIMDSSTPIPASVTRRFASKTRSTIPKMNTVSTLSRLNLPSRTSHRTSNVQHWTNRQFTDSTSLRSHQKSVTPYYTRFLDNSTFFQTSKAPSSANIRYLSTFKVYLSSRNPSSSPSFSQSSSKNFHMEENETKTGNYFLSDEVINFFKVTSSQTAITSDILKISTQTSNNSQFFLLSNVWIVITCTICCIVIIFITCVCCLRKKDSEEQIV